jgi:hypothetical protein
MSITDILMCFFPVPRHWRTTHVKSACRTALAVHGEEAVHAIRARLQEIEREQAFLKACLKVMRHKPGESDYRHPTTAVVLPLHEKPQ